MGCHAPSRRERSLLAQDVRRQCGTHRRGAGSGNEGGEKLGARLCCSSEDIDGPVQKDTEYQEPDERVALEESLRGFVRSAPRASICFWTHHVTAIAARLQSGHAFPLGVVLSVLELARSTWYYHRARAVRSYEEKYAELRRPLE